MSENKPYRSQSISISNSQVSGQIGQAGRDLNQNQVSLEETLASIDIIARLTQIEKIIQSSNFSELHKISAVRLIEVAKEEAQCKEPEKSLAAASLKRATEVLKNADEAVGVGKGLFDRIQPIIESLLPWLGVAKNFFGF
ncbi:MAG: hypothetical protein HC899_05515 [Leptolyngbyaceae cyanobacterium SM1_4_3]|nr:hypothetical protein [Leptolyngbyaceae cyanobacterium SM1_4_3]NJN89869.1 hypothetical protein [Leptolyngbyaceae cyanobacterium SL_5_14]